MTAVALVAKMLLAPQTVRMAAAVAGAVTVVGLLIAMPVAVILVGAGAVEARRQKQNAGGQDCCQYTFCPHGSSS
jgi:hypothetical protein